MYLHRACVCVCVHVGVCAHVCIKVITAREEQNREEG